MANHLSLSDSFTSQDSVNIPPQNSSVLPPPGSPTTHLQPDDLILTANLAYRDTSVSYSPGTNIQAIPVHVTHCRPHIPPVAQRVPYRTNIRRDNRAVQALSLPNIMVANHRSLFPKFYHLVDEILEMDIHLGLHCEIWEDTDNPTHTNMIEEALELHGIQYISTPRKNKRGGGAAITLISNSPFTLTELEPSVKSGDDKLEVCWGLLKPKTPTGIIKSIIICSFYIPPNSRKKTALINHMSLNYFIFKSRYPDSAFIAGGDKNDLNLGHILDIDPSLRQLVTQPTYRQSILDVLITDLGQYYNEPSIRPAVQPDNPVIASSSDHKIVFVEPNSNACQPVKRHSTYRKVRPLPNSALAKFAQWVQHEPWTFVYDGRNSSDMADRLTFLLDLQVNQCCPLRTIKSTNLDGKFKSVSVDQICRRKKREYQKHGNSAKFKQLKKQVKEALKVAARKFINKQVELTGSANNSWLKHVKLLAGRPGEYSPNPFTLPKHV